MHDATTQKKKVLSPEEQRLFRRFIRGELTFAQLEGMTAEEALRIADMGHALFKQGRLDQARTLFDGLAALNPLDPYPHQILGAICEREDDTTRARKHYDVCLSLDPDNVWVLVRRGELLIRLLEPSDGIEDLTRAVRLDPEANRPATKRARLILGSIARLTRGDATLVNDAPPQGTG